MLSDGSEKHMTDPGFKRVVVLSIVMMGLLFGLWEFIEINYIHDWKDDVAHGAHILRGVLAGTFLGATSLGYIALYKGRHDGRLRKVHGELVRLQRFQENLLKSSSIGITTLDEEGRIIYVNPEFCKIMGLSKDELHSMNFLKSLREADDNGWHEAITKTLDESVPFDFKSKPLEFMDVKDLLVDAKGVPLKLDGDKRGLLLILDNVTKQARMEKELVQFEKQASLGVLTGGVAHEINSPLGSLSIIVQRMRRGAHGEHYKEEMDGLDEQIDKINGIVEGLVEFSKRTGTVNDALHIADIISYSLEQVPISEEINLVRGTDTGAIVEGDFEQLSRALSNVIANSVDALEDFDGPKEITIGTDSVNGMAIISVQDTGIGIPEEDLPKIFDPFFSNKTEGTGLGLSITYNVIKCHKGAIDVTSARGLTVFRISLPLVQVSGDVE
jgi:PAS domain S-box-containing protein